MNTPATTPAPQKITPDCQPVFPCWLWRDDDNTWFKAEASDYNYYPSNPCTHWAPDGPRPTCTPTEGENSTPVHDRIMEACNEVRARMNKIPYDSPERAALYDSAMSKIYGAKNWKPLHEEAMKLLAQPTHSAQEAAELREALEFAVTAMDAAEPVTPSSSHAETLIRAAVQKAHDVLHARHFPSTPTQSQQPPLSPGSGEALLLLSAVIEQWDARYKAENWTGYIQKRIGARIDVSRELLVSLRDQLAGFLAQPATPPLTSGEDTDWKALFDRHTEAVGAFLNELYAIMVDPLADGKMEVSEMKAALIEAAKRSRDQSAPPLPSIGDGKDGERLDAIQANPHNLKWDAADGLWYFEFPAGNGPNCRYGVKDIRQAIDSATSPVAMSAQSPQAGREEK